MPGPPPPPPGPPPPPMMMSPIAKKSGGPPDVNALLGQIQKGAKLKKVTTVDKSGPIGAGRIAGEAPPPSSNTSSPAHRSRGGSNKTSPDTSSPVKQPGQQFMNLTDELQFKLTLKKNKSSPTKEQKPAVSETKEVS